MPEKIHQKTEMNQGEEYISLIERSVLYKAADLVFPPPVMMAVRSLLSPEKPFLGQKWLSNSLKKS